MIVSQVSLSARRAWIEIIFMLLLALILLVALRKESVDRNGQCFAHYIANNKVALRKESVDRNKSLHICALSRLLSLSARRAWIEIK